MKGAKKIKHHGDGVTTCWPCGHALVLEGGVSLKSRRFRGWCRMCERDSALWGAETIEALLFREGA